ncbi:glycosyltransferase family 2 protein [Roseobacter litoralis]|uniref:Gylcosyl transferase-like protein n=1 Tax=Roseobacter litoralis (strain ATCC 49566 / DSM 6996 / JCM 21268 / NBRC 15278 / OCh 149) TaxID=391595 RepID=F7ZML9_ROSLO|nr:glycosyltransferase [Roseobacter litoralis]AEI96556.1 gylcosyl transferase-like protein [Roseobacter litoralis Och 149]
MKYGDLISVVVPVYNRAHEVVRSVGSICAQSYQNLEILIVDDCSTDDIEGAVTDLKDSRVRLVRREKNGGAAAARNSGLAAATGDLVAFMDSDDISLFDRFAQEMALFCSLPEDYIGVYAAAIAHTDTTEDARAQAAARVLPPIHRRPLSGNLFDATLEGNFIDMPTMLLKKSAVLAAGPFDERLRNNVDWDFTLRLTRQGKFGFVPQPLYVFSYVPRVASGNDHISHNPRYSVLSYAYITGKLRRAGHVGPALARHYAAAGSYLMRAERPKFARRYFAAARKITPNDPRLLAHLVLSHMPRIHRWARGRSTRFH